MKIYNIIPTNYLIFVLYFLVSMYEHSIDITTLKNKVVDDYEHNEFSDKIEFEQQSINGNNKRLMTRHLSVIQFSFHYSNAHYLN